jgi:hypothetical protein
MSDFEITVDQWLAREHGDEIARATLGQLELRSGGRFLTLLEDRLARTNRTFANLSAYDLAIWLASNWWRLLWEPERAGAEWRMAHSLAAIGGGYVWPDVTMLSDGEQILVQVRPTRGTTWEPIRYLEYWDFSLPILDFELAVDSFIESILARLAGCQISGTELHMLWQELHIERLVPEAASLRKLEALMGFDAGAAPDALIDELLENAQQKGRTAVDEVVAGFGRTAPEIIKQVDDKLNNNGIPLDSTGVKELSRHREAWRLAGPPWERAETAARIAREIWGLNGQPVSTNELVRLVGAEPSLITGQVSANVPMPAAKWTTSDREAWSVVLKSRWEVGKRFELCRLIADGLVAPEGELLLPVTAAKTSRQKFQRAFAQEFLCPSDALLERLGPLPPDDEEIEDAAQYFDVSPLLIRSKLANQGILPRF